MTPTIGPMAAKVWGVTQLGFALNGVEAHAIHIKEGGYCSKHSHQSKWNRFHVISGCLLVRVFPNLSTIQSDDTELRNGQLTDIPPRLVHQFEAMEDTIAVEYYWTDLDSEDINRLTVGGIRQTME